MKTRVHTEFDTELSPEGVVRALIDFSPTRPQIWPNLDPAKYKVHEVRETTALVTEGNRSPNIWARERYDWSQPGRVSWTVEQSNFCAPGSYVQTTITPGPGGGSHVAVDWERTPASATGYVIAGMMKLFKNRLLSADMKKSLDKLARESPSRPVQKAA